MTTSTTTAAQFLRHVGSEPVDVPPHLYGFGGLHGGLSLAHLTATMATHAAPDTAVRSTTARYHRAIREPFRTRAQVRRTGRRATTMAADAVTATGDVLVSADAVFGPADDSDLPVYEPTPPPGARRPEDWDVFAVPTEFVPIAAATEIRPVGADRPYAGGDVPELTAWVRLLDDDAPPDTLALVFLLDALAPSYAAVLHEPRPVPTVELAVQPTSRTPATSAWVLLHARTSIAHHGWVHEALHAWDVDGHFLASARQLRIIH